MGKVTVINAADLEALGSLRPDPAEIALELVWVDVEILKLFPGNARKGDPSKIAESIDENGFFDPPTVQRSTNHVITGNHTLLGAKQRGMKQIPVIYVDVDDARALKMNLVHNKLGDDATYSVEALIAQLTDLDGDFEGSGWNTDELAQLLGDDDEDEEEPEPIESSNGLGVVILAQNEQHQQQIIDDLTGQGYSAAPTTVKNTVKLSNEIF